MTNDARAKRAAAAREYRKTSKYREWRKDYLMRQRVKLAADMRRRRQNPVERERIKSYNDEYKLRKGSEKRKQNTEANRIKKGLPTPLWPEPALCEICGRDSGGRCGMHLEHCHATGKFRGWVCYRCNLAIGMLGDTAEGVMRAVDFLKRAETLYQSEPTSAAR